MKATMAAKSKAILILSRAGDTEDTSQEAGLLLIIPFPSQASKSPFLRGTLEDRTTQTCLMTQTNSRITKNGPLSLLSSTTTKTRSRLTKMTS